MSPARPRDPTVDIARGLAIVAIVGCHALIGVRTTEGMAAPHAAEQLLDATYLVHVVVFALLSGLFVEAGVRRYGRRRYLASRTALFGWLYLVWTMLQRGLRVLTDVGANTRASPQELLRLWAPEGQLWFLPWLLAATVLVVLVRPWASRARGAGLLAVTAVLGWSVWGWEPSYVVLAGLALTPVFVVGSVVGGRRLTSRLSGAKGWPLVLGTLTLGTGYALVVATWSFATPTAGSEDRSAGAVALGVLGSAAGTGAVLGVSALLGRLGGLGGLLAFVGRRSMEIYLGHIVLGQLTRAALIGLGVRSGGLHVLAATLTGLVVPVAVWSLLRRAGLTGLFDLPRPWQARLAGGGRGQTASA